MISHLRLFGLKAACAALVAVVVLFSHHAAVAQTAQGCDPRVYDMMKAYADAQVAVAVAGASEAFSMDDSVLAMTCFNQLAAAALWESTQVFSDSPDVPAGPDNWRWHQFFYPPMSNTNNLMKPVIEDALIAWYDDFFDTVGMTTGAVNYTWAATEMRGFFEHTSYRCKGIAGLWHAIAELGLDVSIPPVTLEHMLNASTPAEAIASDSINYPPGATAQTDFGESWREATKQGIFERVQQAHEALPQPVAMTFPTPQTTTVPAERNPCRILQQLAGGDINPLAGMTDCRDNGM